MKTILIALAVLFTLFATAQEQALLLKSGDYSMSNLKDVRSYNPDELVGRKGVWN